MFNDPATEKQVALLIKLGVDSETASSLSQHDADEAIKAFLGQPTLRQKAFLVRRGFPLDQVNNMSKPQASELISQYYQ